MTRDETFQKLTTDALPASWALSTALTRISADGILTAGISAGIKGMSYFDNGVCKGMDADFGRAVSAVIFADRRDVRFTVVNPNERFSSLADATIDIGLYNASKTLSRELEHEVTFPAVTLFDGEGLLTDIRNKDATLDTWNAPVIGVQGGTTSHDNITRCRKGKACDILSFETLDHAVAALQGGSVDVVVFDAIGLAGAMAEMSNPAQFIILPERISRELMGPVVSLYDPVFARLVEWTFAALVHASDLGITSALVGNQSGSLTPEQAAFMAAGLPMWFQDPLAQQRLTQLLLTTGNSAEIFARNLGIGSDLKITTGLNASTAQGGILYPAPL